MLLALTQVIPHVLAVFVNKRPVLLIKLGVKTFEIDHSIPKKPLHQNYTHSRVLLYPWPFYLVTAF